MTFITDALRPSLGGIEERLEAITSSTRPWIVTARRTALALLFFFVIQVWAHLSITEIVNGLSLGGLYGIIGVALVLTYRTSRIINFAAAAVGAVPAIVACLLSTSEHINYLAVAPIAIIGGLAFGALTDIFVLRRFANASRLIVTVVTIGIAQSYAALGFFIPVWFGDRATGVPKVTTPWQNVAYHNARGEPVLTGNVIAGLVVVVALTAFLAVFLKRSRLGIALRASSESAERAALLGIPVARVQTIAWAFAGLLSSLAIFTQAPLIGVPSDATLGFDTLLYGMAAAVVAKMENVSVALATGLGIGLLISTSVLQTGTNDYASALMLPLILIGLLLQRRSRSRAVESGASTWQTVSSFRPTPIELRTLPEVLRLRAIFILGAVGLTIALPYVVSSPNMPALTILPIFGIIGVSLVVLTGWAGQISLGQFGLVGMAAAVSGGLVAKHNIDFFAAMAIGIAVGAVAAMVIGLPAVRIQGLYLAVTTLAFGYAMQNYVLNINYWPGRHLLPTGYTASIVRPFIYGRFNLEDDKTFYFVCCIFLLLCLLSAASFRRQHSGRILIALRDNQRAASSYSVAPVRTRLAAFAISGAYCGVAGVLFIYLQHNVIAGSYDVFSSVGVFLAASIGGLGSLVGGTLGVIAFEASVLFGPDLWHRLGNTFDSVMPLLLTGPLLILNLYFNPGGLAGWVFGERDKWLRRIANRRKLHVPSLVADSLVVEPMPEPEL